MSKRVLFLCTGNSCRSQMAEGLANALGRGALLAVSAGTEPVGVNPHSIQFMDELGIDIRHHTSDLLTEADLEKMDLLITVCDSAHQTCPIVPAGVEHMHWSISDPAHVEGSEEDIASAFRDARDDLKERIEGLVEGMRGE